MRKGKAYKDRRHLRNKPCHQTEGKASPPEGNTLENAAEQMLVQSPLHSTPRPTRKTLHKESQLICPSLKDYTIAATWGKPVGGGIPNKIKNNNKKRSLHVYSSAALLQETAPFYRWFPIKQIKFYLKWA